MVLYVMQTGLEYVIKLHQRLMLNIHKSRRRERWCIVLVKLIGVFFYIGEKTLLGKLLEDTLTSSFMVIVN